MSLVIIDELIITLKPRFNPGDSLGTIEAKILNKIFLDQLLEGLIQFIADHPNLTNLQVQIEADIISSQMKLEVPDFDHSEEIAKEAQGSNDEITIASAQKRVEARLKAGLEMIKKEKR